MLSVTKSHCYPHCRGIMFGPFLTERCHCRLCRPAKFPQFLMPVCVCVRSHLLSTFSWLKYVLATQSSPCGTFPYVICGSILCTFAVTVAGAVCLPVGRIVTTDFPPFLACSCLFLSCNSPSSTSSYTISALWHWFSAASVPHLCQSLPHQATQCLRRHL